MGASYPDTSKEFPFIDCPYVFTFPCQKNGEQTLAFDDSVRVDVYPALLLEFLASVDKWDGLQYGTETGRWYGRGR